MRRLMGSEANEQIQVRSLLGDRDGSRTEVRYEKLLVAQQAGYMVLPRIA